ncbi:MAG: peptidase C39 family protein [Chloroflexota bacterium]
MIPVILSIKHIRQRAQGDCVVACAAMALDHIGISADYNRLMKLLRLIEGVGTASYHVRELEQLGIVVVYKRGTLTELHDHLTHNRPSIAFVKTADLPYWDEAVDHAVVVAGLDDDHVHLNDPAFDYAPIRVSRGDFGLAWLERDEVYSTFMRQN